jgi:flagellar motor switch protein FliG
MALVFSSLVKLFKSEKKRHNASADATKLTRPLTRAEFMGVYESMPEEARAKLFSTLNFSQKARLLELLTPEKPSEQRAVPEENTWDAEDFLPEPDERKIAKLRQIRDLNNVKATFAKVEAYPADVVSEILLSESASIAAITLLQLNQKYASNVVRAMPELRRAEIVRAMAAEREIASEVLVSISRKLTQRLEEMPAASEQRVDGVKHVNEILKLLGVDEAERITREISAEDQKLGAVLEKNRYTFEDLAGLSAKDFRTLFSSLPDERLWARALKAIDQGRRKDLLGKLPIKRAGLIVTAMADMKSTRLDTIDTARAKILTQALKLASRHEIKFAGNGLH